MKIILASKSPRRKELLSDLFSNFEIITADVDESLDDGISLEEGVRELAVKKGAPVAENASSDSLVISADTLVALDGEALGKPKDEKDACRMLRSLSGREHFVLTGIAVHYKGRLASGVAKSAVRFKELSDKEISDYVSSGEPLDKAGAYGIQGLGGKFVLGYEGDFDTVVGLSRKLTKKLVEEVTG